MLVPSIINKPHYVQEKSSPQMMGEGDIDRETVGMREWEIVELDDGEESERKFIKWKGKKEKKKK